jgi:hypothetical protein
MDLSRDRLIPEHRVCILCNTLHGLIHRVTNSTERNSREAHSRIVITEIPLLFRGAENVLQSSANHWTLSGA